MPGNVFVARARGASELKTIHSDVRVKLRGGAPAELRAERRLSSEQHI